MNIYIEVLLDRLTHLMNKSNTTILGFTINNFGGGLQCLTDILSSLTHSVGAFSDIHGIKCIFLMNFKSVVT